MIRPRGSGGYRGRPRSRSPMDHRPPMRSLRRSPSPGMRRNGSYNPRFHRGGPSGFRGRGRGFRGGMGSGGRDYGGSGGAPYRSRRDDGPPFMRDRDRERSPFQRRTFDREYQPRYGRSPPPRKFIDRGFGGMDRRGSPPPYYSRDRPASSMRRYSPNQGPPRRNYDHPHPYKSSREPGMGYGPPRDGGRSFDDRRRGPPFERRRPPIERDFGGMPPYKRPRGPPDFHEDSNSPVGQPKRPFRDDRRPPRSAEGSPSRDGSRR